MRRRSTKQPLSKETKQFLWNVLNAIIKGDRTYSDGRTSFDFELLQHALSINGVEGLHEALRGEWDRRHKAYDHRNAVRPKKLAAGPSYDIHYRSDIAPEWRPWRDVRSRIDNKAYVLREIKNLRENARRGHEEHDDPWKLEFKIVVIASHKPFLP